MKRHSIFAFLLAVAMMFILPSFAMAQRPSPRDRCMGPHGIDCNRPGCHQLCAKPPAHHPGPGPAPKPVAPPPPAPKPVAPPPSAHRHYGPAPKPVAPPPPAPRPVVPPPPPRRVIVPPPPPRRVIVPPPPPAGIVVVPPPPGPNFAELNARRNELIADNDRLVVDLQIANQEADASFAYCMNLPPMVRGRCVRPNNEIIRIEREINANNREIARINSIIP